MWSSAAALAAAQIGSRVRAEVLDGCELEWGHGTELPLCVSPDCAAEWLSYVAVMTKINYIHWKTFLDFCSPPLSRLLHTSFFMPLGVVQMCATLKGDDEGVVRSQNILEGKLPPHRSQVRYCVLWWNMFLSQDLYTVEQILLQTNLKNSLNN